MLEKFLEKSKMLTNLYFVRHCESDFNDLDEALRGLSQKGLQDRQLIVDYFQEKQVDLIVSSPYKRAIDTITPLLNHLSLPVNVIENFKERHIGSWVEDFASFTKAQWENFSYQMDGGESLMSVQERVTSGLEDLLGKHRGKSLVVSSHGTAIATVIQRYYSSFNYENFQKLQPLMPFVAQFIFDEETCQAITIDNLFTGDIHESYSI